MPKTARAATSARSRPLRMPMRKRHLSPLRIERRCEAREPSSGALAATYSGDGRYGITHLEIFDRSTSGLGALSRTRIEPGMVVTICPEGSRVPWLSARVARCTPEGDKFRLGLAFDHRRAA